MNHSNVRSQIIAAGLACLLALALGRSAAAQTVTPPNIVIGPGSPVYTGGAETNSVQICLPPGSTVTNVDVVLLLDDTGSFKGFVPTLTNIFASLVTNLEASLPSVSFAFGVTRFKDFGGPGDSFSGDFVTARPFILNQPVITAADAGGLAGLTTLINTALSNAGEGFGGDAPEASLCEGLYQVATGVGFDGDGNGLESDSGPAGSLSAQVNPGNSGDVPPFSSNVLPTSGTLGGVGFRANALHVVILASDVCPVAPFPAGLPIPANITNSFGMAIPTSAFTCDNTVGVGRFGYVSDAKSVSSNTVPGAVAPSGSGTVQGAISALNALGIRVICMGPSAAPTTNTISSSDPSTWFSAIARLTGAVDNSNNPLVFNLSVTLQQLASSIVASVSNTTTLPINLTLVPGSTVPSGLNFSFSPTVVSNVAPGNCASFTTVFTGAPTASGSFGLNFVSVGSGSVIGTIPVTVLSEAGPNLVKYNLISGTGVTIGEEFSYQLSFDTFSNSVAAVDLQLVDQLPPQEDFVSATTNGAISVAYNPINNTVTWNFGTFPPLTQGPTNFVTVIVNTKANSDTNIVNFASMLSSNLSVVQTGDRNPRCPTCGMGVMVTTNLPPVIEVNSLLTVSNNPGVCEGTVTPSEVNAGSYSPQGGPLTFALVPPSPYPVGSNSVWFVATDTNGLSASNLVTIIVVDAQPPTIVCPANLVVTNDGTCCDPAVVVLPAPTVTDNCPGVTYVCTRSDGLALSNAYPVGFTTITCTATDASGNTASCCYTVEVTADRTIASTFSGKPIPGGSTLWFSSVISPNLNGACTATIKVIHQSISSADFTLEVPDSEIQFVTNACPATTVFSNGVWLTTVGSTVTGDVFLSGFAYQVPSGGLPGGQPVTWAGTFIGDTTNVTGNWRWAATDYKTFASNYNTIGVKPVDGKQCTIYTNTDDAATPENYKSDINASFKGSGDATWTGTLSAMTTVTACYTMPSPSPSVKINIKLVNGMIQLTWPQGVLQEAPEFSGPYTDVTGATSPYNVGAPAVRKWYRVRRQ